MIDFPILSLTTFVAGLLAIFFYYTISSNLKNTYLNLKNKYSSENEYLAVVNENGLWLKEDLVNYIHIINAKTFKDNNLKNITITQLDKDYNTIETISDLKVSGHTDGIIITFYISCNGQNLIYGELV